MTFIFRKARRTDVPAIVRMLADDPLGAARERCTDPLPDGYWKAFEALDRDPNQELVVAERDGDVVGCLQLTFIPGLSRQGMTRALVEHAVSIYVGDHVADMAAARAAGVVGVGVTTGHCTADELRGAGADTVLAGLDQFASWLKDG